jgi:hypothetical protein
MENVALAMSDGENDDQDHSDVFTNESPPSRPTPALDLWLMAQIV